MALLEQAERPVLSIPPHAEKFIRLQRTHYPAGEALAKHFSRDIWDEYETIRGHLPASAGAVLDIGCGVGGIDAPLFEHFGRDAATRFYMLDKTDLTPKVYYGFQQHAAYYNSLEITREFLEANGVPASNIHLMEATADNRIDLSEPVDIAISLLSWGYHYPVDTYLSRVHELLSPGGKLILDVREKTDGEEKLRAVFGNATRIWEGNSAWRVIAVK